MAGLVKTNEELQIMRDGGKILAQIVALLEVEVLEGNNGLEIDKYAQFLCKRFKVKPAFLGYNGTYPYAICANLNSIIVHGFPTKQKFKHGDIFGLDMGIIYHGFNLDMSTTIAIGSIESSVKDFLEKTHHSMMNGIHQAISDNTVGDISFGMRDCFLSEKFSLMQDFIGHGIGNHLHEKPDIPALGLNRGQGMKLQKGMTLAIESISVFGPSNAYQILPDEWTVITKDNKFLSGLYEHTIIVGDAMPEIITVL